MLSKSVVSGPGKNTLYKELEKATGKAPQWNFHKYLIDRNGKVVANFPGEVAPENPIFLAAIEKAIQ
jgi:glutathione peroxidase